MRLPESASCDDWPSGPLSDVARQADSRVHPYPRATLSWLDAHGAAVRPPWQVDTYQLVRNLFESVDGDEWRLLMGDRSTYPGIREVRVTFTEDATTC